MGVLYRRNDALIDKQLKEAANRNWKNLSVSGSGVSSNALLLAAPVEIPQLYSQLGRFEAKINGYVARVGVSIIPPVGFTLKRVSSMVSIPCHVSKPV